MHVPVLNIAVEICCALFLLTMLLALLFGRERSRTQLMMVLIFAGALIAVAADLTFGLMSADRPMAVDLYLDYILSFSATVFLVCAVTWYLYVRFEEKGTVRTSRTARWLISAYSGLIILLFASSIWTGWFFDLDEFGRLHYTAYYRLIPWLFAPLGLFDLILIWRYRDVLGTAETAVMYLYCALPIAASIVDMRRGTVFAYLALTLGACMLYTFIDAEQEQRLARTRQELAEMHLNTMVSQINPHFILNTLGSIESLSADRPEEARQLMSAFSEYLSDNYVDLTHRPLVRFEEELRHVEHYLTIEKVRFPNLNVVYDIQTKSFELPCLSVQPLAENAVKHGICRRRRSAGTLTISTEETESAFVVRVADDGIGFVAADSADSGRAHVGIENVSRRLELLLGGSLDIRSTPGVGTVCIITIPKGGARRDRIVR